MLVILRRSACPLALLITSVSPAVTLRSSVMVRLSPLIATTRPPFARPANTSSDIAIIADGLICSSMPSSPTANDTCRLSNCSDFNAHRPARCACPWLVQPIKPISSVLMPYLAIAASSRTNSYSVLNSFCGLSHATLATVWRSRARVPV